MAIYLTPIIPVRMFVTIPPVCSLLRAIQSVEGPINLVPFRSPMPVPVVFAAIPSMVVPVVAVVVPPLLIAVVAKIVGRLNSHWRNEPDSQQKRTQKLVHTMHVVLPSSRFLVAESRLAATVSL